MPRSGLSCDDSVLRVPKLSSFFRIAVSRSSDTDCTSFTMRGSRSDCCAASVPLKPHTTARNAKTAMTFFI